MSRAVLVLGVALLTGSLVQADPIVIKGTSQGTFEESSPGWQSGTGTSAFYWGWPYGDSDANVLRFHGTSFEAQPGEIFAIGMLEYINGETILGTNPPDVTLALRLQFDQPPLSDQLHLFPGDLYSTPNEGTPEENADFVSFTFVNFHVLEHEQANVTLLARFDADLNLEILGPGEIDGGGFVTPVDSALETPEPTGLLLAALGAVGMGCWQHRRRRANRRNQASEPLSKG